MDAWAIDQHLAAAYRQPFATRRQWRTICWWKRIRLMTGKLEGKVAIITGASAGIGQASARALA
ncbi:MAG: hypothetical protein ACXWJ8_04210, partial [Xanthobacteraceae bacterium]